MIRASALPLAISLALLPVLAGCTGGSAAYPSLARRPVERIAGTAPVVTPVAEPIRPIPDPATLSGIAVASARAAAADARFASRLARTRQLVANARGSAVASEPWAVATVALADLESSRSEAMIALADLDGLYAATQVAGADTAAIAAARAQVLGVVAGQDKVLAELSAGLRSR